MAHHQQPNHHGPPLLLTKRLTTFLQTNISTSPHIHTAILATPTGRLLAHASASPAHALPVRTLRTQTTVAASLWAMHDSDAFAESVRDTLPDGTHTGTRGPAHVPPPPQHASAVTVQLASGAVFVIRQLRCGLLFVCVGPGGAPLPSLAAAQAAAPAQAQIMAKPETGGGNGNGGGTATGNGAAPGAGGAIPAVTAPAPIASPMLGSPSEAESVLSTGTGAATTTSQATSSAGGSSAASTGNTTAGVAVIRRHAEEIARSLDERLGALSVPEEGTGGDGR